MLLESESSLSRRLRRRMVERKAARLTELADQPVCEPATDRALAVAYERRVRNELRAIDGHAKALAKQLERSAEPRQLLGAVAARDYRQQELATELAELAGLRKEIEGDLINKVMSYADGRPMDERAHARRRFRAREIAENKWSAAERAERAGEHRRARQLRHDALRARHIAEFEMGLRKSLRGYSYPG